MTDPHRTARRTRGLAALLAAQVAWGVMPLLVAATAPASPMTSTLWRAVVFTSVALILLCAPAYRAAIRQAGGLAVFLTARPAAPALLMAQWGVFAWLVLEGRVLDATLGLLLRPVGVYLADRPACTRRTFGVIAGSLAGVAGYAFATPNGPGVPVGGLAVTGLYVAYTRAITTHRPDPGVPGLAALTVETIPYGIAAGLWLASAIWTGAPPAGWVGGVVSMAQAGWLVIYGLAALVPWWCFQYGAQVMPARTVAATSALSPVMNAIVGVCWLGVTVTNGQAVALVIVLVASLAMHQQSDS